MNVRFETRYGNRAGKHEWLTPPELVETLGPFDLDPCYSEPRPWPTAGKHYGVEEDGLLQPWHGFVWCNPPYGEHAAAWLQKLSEYKHCIALIFARTETRMFREYIWDRALAVFFMYGRIRFYNTDGAAYGSNAGAPSCLVAWDDEGVSRLKRLSSGKLVFINGMKEER